MLVFSERRDSLNAPPRASYFSGRLFAAWRGSPALSVTGTMRFVKLPRCVDDAAGGSVPSEIPTVPRETAL